MPQLNWIGKEKIVNHHKEIPYRVLKPIKELSVGENSENLLIEGDNLEALKALMPFYYGRIDCIYIDPPYNTGNEGWIYNDKLNSPQIKSWLNKVVGAEGEDLCRHDKWLCMMYPRLKLLHELLSENGVIFISIDDNEGPNLKLILDEIWGPRNFVANFIWNHRKSSQNDIDVSLSHNYTYCYAKKRDNFRLNSRKINVEKFSNPDNDPRGNWSADPFDAPGVRENLQYEIKNPNTGVVYLPPKGRHWRFSKEKYLQAIQDNRVLFGKTGKSKPQFKRFYFEAQEKGENIFTIWNDIGTATEGTKDIMKAFNGEKVFDTPKPISLIKRILEIATHPNSLILDSFAGSGTTGHAVLEVNKEDGGNRKFILVEMEGKIAQEITAKRLRKVIEGYKNAKFPQGTGQGVRYLDLNGELYDNSGFVNLNAKYEDMAAYIYFSEAKSHLDLSSIKNPYIGSQGSTHYFLFFEGKNNNVLDERTLKKTEDYNGTKVIYGDKCLLDNEHMAKHNITFKQIPYELKKY